jgi:hypothetical protein
MQFVDANILLNFQYYAIEYLAPQIEIIID